MTSRLRHLSGVAVALFLVVLPSTDFIEAQNQPGRTVIAAGWRDQASLPRWDALIDQMVRNRELVLYSIQPDPGFRGRQHEHYLQLHRGLRVEGGEIARQAIGGRTISVFGTIYTGIDVDVAPALTSFDAAAGVQQQFGVPMMAASQVPLVLPTLLGGYELVYRLTLADGKTHYVDAQTGAVRMTIDEVMTQSAVGRGTGFFGDPKKLSVTRTATGFEARDQMRPARVVTQASRGVQVPLLTLFLNGSPIATDADNVWADPGVVDGHVHLGWMQDYLFKRHQWRGLDGANGPVTQIVVDRLSLSNNALFAQPPTGPAGQGLLVFGETSSGVPLTVLDIVGHEAMHGVTFFSIRQRTGSGLGSFLAFDTPGPASVVVGGQTLRCGEAGIRTANSFFPFVCVNGNFATASSHGGAVNEGFSDVFGAAAEFFFQRAGSGPLTADYLMGEDVPEIGTASRGQAGPTRSLENPSSLHVDSTRTLRYPDHFSKRLRFAVVDFIDFFAVSNLAFTDTDAATLIAPDNGGVHWNSTLFSHVFYLAVEGGQNATSGRTVQGVGAANRGQIERLFFRAMTQLMPSNTTFSMTASLLSQAAVDLFGANSAAARAIDQALVAVGLQ